jgi:hypothetical protein
MGSSIGNSFKKGLESDRHSMKFGRTVGACFVTIWFDNVLGWPKGRGLRWNVPEQMG